MIDINEIYRYLDSVMPFSSQEKWDNSGLIVENTDSEADKILVCLDVTHEAVKTAIAQECKIIVAHHPIIFYPILKLDANSVVGEIIKNDIGVISAHTNFDKYKYGTSYILKEFLQLKGKAEAMALGIIVDLEKETEVSTLLKDIKQKTNFTIKYTTGKTTVNRVFVIAGSGKGMTQEIIQSGADCVITGESGYHDEMDLQGKKITTICIGHHISEQISVLPLGNIIKERFKDIEIIPYIKPPICGFY